MIQQYELTKMTEMNLFKKIYIIIMMNNNLR